MRQPISLLIVILLKMPLDAHRFFVSFYPNPGSPEAGSSIGCIQGYESIYEPDYIKTSISQSQNEKGENDGSYLEFLGESLGYKG
jgi:hypothetical protein